MFGFFYLIARAGSEVSAMIICVIFDLGMAVIMFLFGICFVKSNGKAAAFLSGYNMKSKEERKQYDEEEMCRVYGNRMMWMALPFVVGAAIDLLYSGIGCFAACVIWTFQFVLLMKERMKREKIEKNIWAKIICERRYTSYPGTG